MIAACSGAAAPREVATAPPTTTGALYGNVSVRPVTCGGMQVRADRPEPPPFPLDGGLVLVRAGDRNSDAAPVAEVKTSASGDFTAPVSPGRYCVVTAAKRDRPTAGTEYQDLDCLVEDWSTCDAVVDVPAAHPAQIMLAGTCAVGPCYHGPPPP